MVYFCNAINLRRVAVDAKKVCSKCEQEKTIMEFEKVKLNKDGYSGRCRECINDARREHYKKNRERLANRQKVYYHNNKEKVLSYVKRYNKNNKERKRKYDEGYRAANKQSIKNKNKAYYQKNKEKRDKQNRAWAIKNKEAYQLSHKAHRDKNKDVKREYDQEYREINKEALAIKGKVYRDTNHDKLREYCRKRLQMNPNAKLALILRTRIRMALKYQKTEKANRVLCDLTGCSILELRLYLENQFTEGMTWKNHGMHGWHIDHIKPCAMFDLTDPEQQKECFHYTNYQPLWAVDNLKKSSIYAGKRYSRKLRDIQRA